MSKRQVFTVLSLSLLLVVAGAYALMASGQETEATVCCGGGCGSCDPGECATGSTCAAKAGAACNDADVLRTSGGCAGFAASQASVRRVSAGCAGSTCAPGQGCAPQKGCSAGSCSSASQVRVIGVRDARTGQIAYYALTAGQLRALQARSAGKVARAAFGPDVVMATTVQADAKPVR